MSSLSRPPLLSIEWLLLMLILLAAVVIAAAMIHVVTDFGYTALGRPAVVQALAR